MSNEKDIFAEIAHKGIGGRPWLMEESLPAEHGVNPCVLTDHITGEYAVPCRSQDTEGLKKELTQLKAQMAPFLQNHAPKQASCKKQLEIKEFLLDGQEPVTIPHYGGPIGYGFKTYEADFAMERIRKRRTMPASVGRTILPWSISTADAWEPMRDSLRPLNLKLPMPWFPEKII